jgi:hypothetical protein
MFLDILYIVLIILFWAWICKRAARAIIWELYCRAMAEHSRLKRGSASLGQMAESRQQVLKFNRLWNKVR